MSKRKNKGRNKILASMTLSNSKINCSIVKDNVTGNISGLIQGYEIYHNIVTVFYEIAMKCIMSIEDSQNQINEIIMEKKASISNIAGFKQTTKRLNDKVDECLKFLDVLVDNREALANKSELECFVIGNHKKTLHNLISKSHNLSSIERNILSATMPNMSTHPYYLLFRLLENDFPVHYPSSHDYTSGDVYIREIYDLVTLPENVLHPENYEDSVAEVLSCISDNISDSSLICVINQDKFYELIHSNPSYNVSSDFISNSSYNVSSDFISNLSIFVSIGDKYAPFILNCVKINNFEYDYEVVVISLCKKLKDCKYVGKAFNEPDIRYERIMHYFYNSKTQKVAMRCSPHCAKYCKNHKNKININLSDTEPNKDESIKYGYCANMDDCYINKFVYSPTNILNVIGYIQHLFENRSHTSKLKNYDNKDKNTNGFGVKLLNDMESNSHNETADTAKWITIKEYYAKERETNRIGSSHIKHKSPCEHYRSGHTRVLKNGKVVHVNPSVVNRGKKTDKAIYNIE